MLKIFKRKDGFTLIELIIVISIIGILTSIVTPNLMTNTRKAEETKINANLKTFYNGAQITDRTENKFEIGDGTTSNLITNPELINKVNEYANIDNGVELTKYDIEKSTDKKITIKYTTNEGIVYKYPDEDVKNK